MIGGYVLFSRNSRFEELCRKSSEAPLEEFVFEACGYTAWFFHNMNKEHSRTNVYHDQANLLLIDGMAVTRDVDAGYRFFEPSKDFSPDSQEAFKGCIDKIVSDVNAILINHSPQGITINFSSNRAAGGRIWFSKPLNNKGIVLCDDYRPLMAFNHSEIEPKAIYSILQYGVSPDPITIVKGISCVPQSHFGVCKSEDFKVAFKPYFRFDFPETNDCNLEPSKGLLRQSADFLRSVDPVLLLSGGVDSTLLAFYLKAEGVMNAFFLSCGSNDPQLFFAEEAAKETGVALNTIRMTGKDILPSIKEIASAYIYPFKECATISGYYLMKQIESACGGRCVVIDGTGADSSFGIEVVEYSYMYRLACYQPMIARKICQVLYEKLGIYRRDSKIEKLMHLLALSDRDVRLTTTRGFPIDPFFNQEVRDIAKDVDSAFTDICTSCMEPNVHNKSFYPEVTVASFLIYVRANLLNTYKVGREPTIEVVYPYLWKDILIEQGRLSWSCKYRKGVNKWPLKKLLEEFVSPDFAYRRKSGFTPPLTRWLNQKDICTLASDILLGEKSYISDVVSRKEIASMVNDLSGLRQIQRNLSFLWGAMFIEMWLQENYKIS